MSLFVDHDLTVAEVAEAECRRVMAERFALKRRPGTHGDQAVMVGAVDALLDAWLEANRGQGSAPHA